MAKSTKSSNKKNTASKTVKKEAVSTSAAPVSANAYWREICGACLLFLAVVIVIGYFNDEAAFIAFISRLMKGLVGWGVYLAAPAFLIAGLTLLFHKGRPVALRTTSALVLPVLLSNIVNMLRFITPTDKTGFVDLASFLYDQGVVLKSGGVLGGLPSIFLQRFLGGGLTIGIFIVLFVLCLIFALDLDLKSAVDSVAEKARERAESVQEEAEPPVRTPEPLPVKKTAMPQRVSDPHVATSPRPSVRISSKDIPIGEEGEALPLNRFEDDRDSGRTTAKVRRRTGADPLNDDGTDASSLTGMDIGDGWKQYKGPVRQVRRVTPSEGLKKPVPAEPEVKTVKKEEKKQEPVAVPVISENQGGNRPDEAAYVFPTIDLLEEGVSASGDAKDEIELNRERLENAMRSFGISACVSGVIRGPTVTRYDFELDQGVKLSRVTNLAGDLALALGVVNVRIAPIPEKISTIGIEVPNKIVSTVYLRSILESQRFLSAKSKISFAVGKDIGGNCIVGDIAKLPHMLIAGTTGSGKSVCMNSLILSLLYKARPDEVKFIMIDPKMVELGIYSGIPHMLTPVVTEPKKASGALQWAVVEMLKRYRLFSESGVRDIDSYNRHCETTGEERLPQVIVVIDELADLMMIAAKEVEESICRIAQMGRAAGMHLIVATQRPSADVITGLMKANIPSRIAFAVSSAMESRIILDQGGAEKLIGMGDMLYSPLGSGKPKRIQGAFVSDEERERVIDFIKENNPSVQPSADKELGEYMTRAEQSKDSGKEKEKESESLPGSDYDEMLPQAVEAILDTKQCSVSMLQRRVKLGYSRAARIVDQMEELGIVGPYEGAKPRAVLIDREAWREMKAELGLAAGDDFDIAREVSEEE